MLTTLLILFIAGYSCVPADAAATKKQKVDSPILFPESMQEVDFMERDKNEPLSCRGQTYCTIKPDDYPEEKFNEMFKGYKGYPQPKLLLDPLQNKQGDPNDKNDCESEVSFEPIYKVREKRDEPWRYVVQAPESNFVQSLRLEKCLNTGSPCFTMFSSSPGYGTHCKQINSLWEVMVAKGDNGTEPIKLQTTQGAEIAGRALREGDRSIQNPNGSYKILNRFAKPLVRRRVPGGVVFPGENSASMGVVGFMEPLIPESCRKIGICDDVPNYPDELVSRLIQQIQNTNLSRFNQDVLEIPIIAQRISPEEDTMSLCDSVEKIYAPQAAQDSSKEWHLIVNDKTNPQQTFRVEICKTKESSCSSVAYFQNGYEARCVQKFMLRKMLALNENKEVVERPFQVPSCCSCLVKNVN